MLEIFGISKIDSGKWMDTDQCISDYQRESTRNINAIFGSPGPGPGTGILYAIFGSPGPGTGQKFRSGS